MTFEEIKILLESAFPDKVAYFQWPIGEVPALPYVVWYETGESNFGADNIVYHSFKDVTIELYMQFKEPESESLLESVLTDAGIFYTKDCTYIEDEKVFETIYEIEV